MEDSVVQSSILTALAMKADLHVHSKKLTKFSEFYVQYIF